MTGDRFPTAPTATGAVRGWRGAAPRRGPEAVRGDGHPRGHRGGHPQRLRPFRPRPPFGRRVGGGVGGIPRCEGLSEVSEDLRHSSEGGRLRCPNLRSRKFRRSLCGWIPPWTGPYVTMKSPGTPPGLNPRPRGVPIEDIFLIKKDGQATGACFVKYDSLEACDAAIQELDGIRRASRPTHRPIGHSGFPLWCPKPKTQTATALCQCGQGGIRAPIADPSQGLSGREASRGMTESFVALPFGKS